MTDEERYSMNSGFCSNNRYRPPGYFAYMLHRISIKGDYVRDTELDLDYSALMPGGYRPPMTKAEALRLISVLVTGLIISVLILWFNGYWR